MHICKFERQKPSASIEGGRARQMSSIIELEVSPTGRRMGYRTNELQALRRWITICTLPRLQTIEQVIEHLLERGMTGASAVFSSGNDKHVRGSSQHQGKLVEYSFTVLFPTCFEGLRVTPMVGNVTFVLNVVDIVSSGELGQ